MDLPSLSALELRAAYRSGEASPVEAIEALAARIEALEPQLGAFTTTTLEQARERAGGAERAYREGSARPLEGIPLAIKDLYDTAGVRTTYGSSLFADQVPERDATAVRLALGAGAIPLGKTTTHEFAWGITTDNPHFLPCRNPWRPDRIPGGSSGGSGVALAANEAPLALGTDTGGSIRIPAGFCGVVGLKPTYGRVSLAGVMPLARTLDHAGPMARTPADAALLLEAIAGADPADPATRSAPLGDLEAGLEAGARGLRVGLSPALVPVELEPPQRAAFEAAAQVLGELGADLVEVEYPGPTEIYDPFLVIQRCEALRAHRERGLFPQHRSEYGPDVRARMESAETLGLADYLDACEQRDQVRAGFARLLEQVDLLLTPVAAVSPPPIGEDEVPHGDGRISLRAAVMGLTCPQDIAGLPACALRAGFDDLGLPIGVQLTGPAWSEARVLGAAQALHEATPAIQQRRPELGL